MSNNKTSTDAMQDGKPVPNNFSSIYCWNTQDSKFTYPELDPASPLFYEPIAGRPNSGICISGGGSISASLIAGYFAALKELGLMDSLRYISGVSGGTWGSAPYVYLPADNTTFSGSPQMPGSITLNNISGAEDNSMQRAAIDANIVDASVGLIRDILLNHVPADHVYEEAVGSIFLNNFGINSPASMGKYDAANTQYFSSTPDMVNKIKSRNPGVPNGFMTMAKNAPYLIMNTTMFVDVPKGSKGNDPNGPYQLCPFEFTPNYCGIKAPQAIPGRDDLKIGGSFVESFGFNTQLTGTKVDEQTQQTYAQATGDYPFELCQPVGASGSALETMLEDLAAKLNIPIKDAAKVLLKYFPNFSYWNPTAPAQPTATYKFGDGGCIEDTGITPLLARGVENIVAFLTEPVFFPNEPNNTISMPGFGERAFGYNQIACLFGEATIDAKASKATINDKNPHGTMICHPKDTSKQVFDNKNGEFEQLLSDLYAIKNNGGPLIIKQALSVIPNPLFGVPGNYTAQIILSVVDTCDNWTTHLTDTDVKDYITNKIPDFPEVKVFLQNWKKMQLIKLTPQETNLLADFGYWMVMQQSEVFKGVLTGAPETASA